jgi:hypothetical protein
MKKLFYILILTSLIGINVLSQDGRHSVGVSIGYGIPFEYSIYIEFDDPDFEIWSTPSFNLTEALIYNFALNDWLKIGARFEHEKINFESFYTDKTFANRYSIGFEFLCDYPKTTLHAEFGGYFHIGRINSNDFDNPVIGFDNGLQLGPAIHYENIDIAFLFQPCFGYYFLSGGTGPDSGLIMYPKSTMRISYSF